MGRPKIPLDTKYPDQIADVRVNLSFIYSRMDTSAGPTACWTYRGAHHRQGYPMCGGVRLPDMTKIMMTIHRLFLKQKLGHDPGSSVDAVHTCGNMRCINPDHLVPGDARLLTQLKIQRGNYNMGRPVGYRLTAPRRQNYRYGVDNLRALYRRTITIEEFAARTGCTVVQARRLRKEIDTGQCYGWVGREAK
jgi:hypothetical protein